MSRGGVGADIILTAGQTEGNECWAHVWRLQGPSGAVVGPTRAPPFCTFPHEPPEGVLTLPLCH